MDLKELAAIAQREMAKHGLHDWTFGFADTKRQLGVCKYRKKRIEMSEFASLNSPQESVIDTLMHEIAHAIAGHAAGHGPVWKAVALRVGASPRSCAVATEQVVQPGDWQATCPACQRTFHRYKRPKSLSGYRCKCAAQSPIAFAFMGDPAFQPVLPATPQEAAKWVAKCPDCEFVHLRFRRPKAGVWRCKCPKRSEIIWRFRTQGSAGG